MSRKDYKAIAAVLNRNLTDIRNFLEADSRNDALLAFDALVSRLCCAFQEDNPNFKSAVFRDAVYGND